MALGALQPPLPSSVLSEPPRGPQGARNSRPPEQHRDAIAHQWELIPLIKHALMWLPLCRLPLEHLLSPPRAVPRLNLLHAQVESEMQEWGAARHASPSTKAASFFRKKGLMRFFSRITGSLGCCLHLSPSAAVPVGTGGCQPAWVLLERLHEGSRGKRLE